MNPIDPKYAGDSPQINERLWQAWVCKNREMDRAGAARRNRFLQFALVIGITVLVVRSLLS